MPQPKHKQVYKARTSLKEGIQLASTLYEPPVTYNTRTSFDLRRIVEDQWRKDLQKQMEEEEKDRQKALMEQQMEEEEFQRKMTEARAAKFKKTKKTV